MIEAAEKAGVRRFIVDDFGWGPGFRSEAEFESVGAKRRVPWDFAAQKARENKEFTWTGVTSGNPIDWVGGSSLSDGRSVVATEGGEEQVEWGKQGQQNW